MEKQERGDQESVDLKNKSKKHKLENIKIEKFIFHNE